METNQLMRVEIGDFRLPIEHLTMMGNLNELWTYGNSIRQNKGKSPLDLKNYLRQKETLEFVQTVEDRVFPKCVQSTHYKIEEKTPGRYEIIGGELNCLKTKRGKGGGTWAHLYLLLDAAARLDPEFRLQIYEAFVAGKILKWRDDSGEEFKKLNIAIDAYLPEREGKTNKNIFINVAKMLKSKLIPGVICWNEANSIQLENRTRVEEKLILFLQSGLIRNWEHLKEVINNL